MSKVPHAQTQNYKHPGQIPGYRTASHAAQRAETLRTIAQKQIKTEAKTSKAPEFYAGESIGPNRVLHTDVERLPSGRTPSKRNKIMRRILRGALRRTFSSLTKPMRLARGLDAQAREVARDEKKSSRFARRLLAKELAIHQVVYAPNKPELRKMRTAARAAARKGPKKDAIAQLVDAMSSKP